MRAVLLTTLLLALAPARASADPKAEAKLHLDRAMAHHKAGKYADALTELKIAYTLDPQPALLYAIGQVHVMQGQCDQAISFYQRFIDSNPGPAQVAKAQEAIDTCKKLAPDRPADPVPPVDTPVEPPPPPPQKVTIVTRTAPWYTDVVGDVLVGSGVLAGVASALFYRSALSDRDAADTSGSYARYDELVASAEDKQTMAIVFGVGGIALATAGVVSYVVRDRRVETQTLSVAPTRDGGVITWFARF